MLGLLRHVGILNLNRKWFVVGLVLIYGVKENWIIRRAISYHARLELGIPLLLNRWRHGNVILPLRQVVRNRTLLFEVLMPTMLCIKSFKSSLDGRETNVAATGLALRL